MGFSLESIGMKEGGRYESIFTTMNQNEEMDAAPIGVKCIGDEEIESNALEMRKLQHAYSKEAQHLKT